MEKKQPKNIVVCCDGTANELTERNKFSNVIQLFCQLEKDPARTTQVAYYDPGVGTRGYSRFLDRWDQATGWTVDENVKQAYEFLMNFYEPGDSIFLFGFSRGAYTVRVLSGLITKSGLLHKRNANLIEYAFKVFRRSGNEVQANEFRKNLSQDVRIAFLGVWDTVSTVWRKGLFRKLPDFFADSLLSGQVDYACQALSIDDRRRALFPPILWDPTEPLERMEQVWFAGAHSDVGGGYAEDAHGRRLARVPLQWMLQRAQDKGLQLKDNLDADALAQADDFLGEMHHPDREGLWKWLSFLNGPRTIPAGQAIRGTDRRMLPRIHEAVCQRLKTRKDYQPENLPTEYVVVNDKGQTLERVSAVKRPGATGLLKSGIG